jgi:hypothetical protein
VIKVFVSVNDKKNGDRLNNIDRHSPRRNKAISIRFESLKARLLCVAFVACALDSLDDSETKGGPKRFDSGS